MYIFHVNDYVAVLVLWPSLNYCLDIARDVFGIFIAFVLIGVVKFTFLFTNYSYIVPCRQIILGYDVLIISLKIVITHLTNYNSSV
jgi:hypothetical protein